MPGRLLYILITLVLGRQRRAFNRAQRKPLFVSGNFMTTRILTILTIIVLASCKDKTTKVSRIKSVASTDSTCLKDLEKAKKDLEKGKLVYCHYAGNILFSQLRSEKQMTELLLKYQIEYKNEMSSCVIYEGQTEHCYCELMDEMIKDKFGQHFLDSLLAISDSLYAFSNPLDTFHYSKCDTWPRFPGEFEDMEFSYKLQDIFDSNVKYPKEYIIKEHRDTSAFVDVSFIVDKNGNASDIGFWFIFDHEENKKYKDYFISVIKPLITETKWQPATVRKQIVISDMNIRIGFE